MYAITRWYVLGGMLNLMAALECDYLLSIHIDGLKYRYTTDMWLSGGIYTLTII